MALRRSARSTTIAATERSTQNAAAVCRKRIGRRADRGGKHAPTNPTLQSSSAQPAEPVEVHSGVQKVTSGKRKRDDHVGQTGASKKRQLEEPSSNDAAARLRMADQTIHAQHEQISPANVPAVEQDK